MKLIAALTVALGLAFAAPGLATADAPAQGHTAPPAAQAGPEQPTIHVVNVSGCTSTFAAATASGYCTHVVNGGWYYLAAVCTAKGGATYAPYTSRSYLAWATKIITCATGYRVTSARLVTSTQAGFGYRRALRAMTTVGTCTRYMNTSTEAGSVRCPNASNAWGIRILCDRRNSTEQVWFYNPWQIRPPGYTGYASQDCGNLAALGRPGYWDIIAVQPVAY